MLWVGENRKIERGRLQLNLASLSINGSVKYPVKSQTLTMTVQSAMTARLKPWLQTLVNYSFTARYRRLIILILATSTRLERIPISQPMSCLWKLAGVWLTTLLRFQDRLINISVSQKTWKLEEHVNKACWYAVKNMVNFITTTKGFH